MTDRPVIIGIDLASGPAIGVFSVRCDDGHVLASGHLPNWAGPDTRWEWFNGTVIMADPDKMAHQWTGSEWEEIELVNVN